MNEKKDKKIVVLATGGTIAGWADDGNTPENYRAGRLDVGQLLSVVKPSTHPLVSEQLAQVDSKDMVDGLWRALVERCAYWLAQTDVQGIVVTHGTDTLEETAYFLQAVLQPLKPVVLTCAMRAANAPDSDGPRNLQDAITLAAHPCVAGVRVVCAGEVHAGHEVQKVHSHRLNPFVSGEEGPLGLLQLGVWTCLREPSILHGSDYLPTLVEVLACDPWPHVEFVMSHAGANGALVNAMLAVDPPAGWVVIGTGNATVHRELQRALEKAQAGGAMVVRTTRCPWGGVQSRTDDVFAHAGKLTSVQARVALILALIYQKKGR